MSIKSQEGHMRQLALLLTTDLGCIFDERESGPNGSKKAFLNVGKVFLRALAKDLGLHEVTVSANSGGIAVSGTCSLYGMWEDRGIAVWIEQRLCADGKVLCYRTIRSSRDFKGGYNHFLTSSDLKTWSYPQLLETLSALRKDGCRYTNEGHTYPIPTISFFAASNEIPNFNDPQEKILEALYDRLELKVVTANIEDRNTRLAVLKNKQSGAFGQVSATITLEELIEMQREVAEIPVPDSANELADDILCELRKSMAVSDRKYLGYYPIAQARAWLSGHDKVESSDLLALKDYLWHLPADREKVENVLKRLCINPMQEKVNSVREMALDSQAGFEEACGDGSRTDLARKAFIKLRGELVRLYQKQCELRASAQSDSEAALVDSLLTDLEDISRRAHEKTGFTYTPLSEIAALN